MGKWARILPKSRWGRLAIAVFVVGVVWFAAVDRSAYYEECRRCHSDRMRVAVRICGIECATQFHSEHERFESRLARDLGCACPHDYARLLVARRFGLAVPLIAKSVPYHLWHGEAPSWYIKNASTIIKGLKTENPSIGEEFRDRVLLKSDDDYMRQVIQKMRRHLSAEDAKEFDRGSS